jgi:hypothetical protein
MYAFIDTSLRVQSITVSEYLMEWMSVECTVMAPLWSWHLEACCLIGEVYVNRCNSDS